MLRQIFKILFLLMVAMTLRTDVKRAALKAQPFTPFDPGENDDVPQHTTAQSFEKYTGEEQAEKSPGDLVVVPREKLAKITEDLQRQMDTFQKLVSRTEEIRRLFFPEILNMGNKSTTHDVGTTESSVPEGNAVLISGDETMVSSEKHEDVAPTLSERLARVRGGLRRQLEKAKELLTGSKETDESAPPDRVEVLTKDEIPKLGKPLEGKRDVKQSPEKHGVHQLKARKPEWPANLKFLYDRQDSDTVNKEYRLVTLTVDQDRKPQIIRHAAVVPEIECSPTEHDADMLIMDCAACSVRPNMFKPGVFVECYNCHRLQADGTCMVDQEKSVFRISSSYFYPNGFTEESCT